MGVTGGLDTAEQIAADASLDCNGDGILDACQIAAGTLIDANKDGIPDDCACRADWNDDGFVNSQDRQTNTFDLCILTDSGAATGASNEVVDVDAGTTGSYTRDAATMNNHAVGFCRRNTNTLFLDGDIAMILELSSAASSGERTALTTYINTQFGTSWSPA